MNIKDIKTKICTITLGLFCIAANAGKGMGMDSTDIVPFSMMPISNAYIYVAPTYTSPPQVNGKCGSDSGVTVYVEPTGLCSVGSSSTVTQSGSTYNWSCAGQWGGKNASCSANLYVAPPPAPSGGGCSSIVYSDLRGWYCYGS